MKFKMEQVNRFCLYSQTACDEMDSRHLYAHFYILLLLL